jgi:hypothetical protein
MTDGKIVESGVIYNSMAADDDVPYNVRKALSVYRIHELIFFSHDLGNHYLRGDVSNGSSSTEVPPLVYQRALASFIQGCREAGYEIVLVCPSDSLPRAVHLHLKEPTEIVEEYIVNSGRLAEKIAREKEIREQIHYVNNLPTKDILDTPYYRSALDIAIEHEISEVFFKTRIFNPAMSVFAGAILGAFLFGLVSLLFGWMG